MDNIILFLKGIIIGIANAIPGVSGGTLALMLGIYEDLINGIKAIDLIFIKLILKGKFKKAFHKIPVKLFLLISSGALCSILLLSKIFVWLLQNKPVLINAFFFGLIFATIPIISKFIKKWTIGKIIVAIISTIMTYFIVNLVPIQTPDSMLFVFLCGVIAISAMILPGLSGSFMLIILGKYYYILNAINNKNISVLIIFSAGLAFGIISFVRVLSWLFNKFHDMTIAVLTGLVIGSLDKIWPWKNAVNTIIRHDKIIPIKQTNFLPSNFNMEFFSAIGLIIIGIAIAFLLNTSSDNSIEIKD